MALIFLLGDVHLKQQQMAWSWMSAGILVQKSQQLCHWIALWVYACQSKKEIVGHNQCHPLASFLYSDSQFYFIALNTVRSKEGL